MCWLLIRAFSDAKLTAWKLGDIVEVRPDDFTGWGTEEGLPKFYRVQIQGVPAERVKARLEAVDETRYEFEPERPRIFNRVRLYGIKPADVPASARATLQSTGQLSITKTQALNYIRDNLGIRVPSLD